MTRIMLLSCLTGMMATAGQALPDVSLASTRWKCTAGASVEAGVAQLTGRPDGYTRVTMTLPGALLADKTFDVSAQVKTHAIQPGQDLVYASPKLKMIHSPSRKVLAVNNFGHKEHGEWTPVHLQITFSQALRGPVELELGLQFCSGTLEVSNVAITETEPWRWRVLDGDHKSYFDK